MGGVWGGWESRVLHTGNLGKYRCKSVQLDAFWGHQIIKSGTEIRRFSAPLLKVGRNSLCLPCRFRGSWVEGHDRQTDRHTRCPLHDDDFHNCHEHHRCHYDDNHDNSTNTITIITHTSHRKALALLILFQESPAVPF